MKKFFVLIVFFLATFCISCNSYSADNAKEKFQSELSWECDGDTCQFSETLNDDEYTTDGTEYSDYDHYRNKYDFSLNKFTRTERDSFSSSNEEDLLAIFESTDIEVTIYLGSGNATATFHHKKTYIGFDDRFSNIDSTTTVSMNIYSGEQTCTPGPENGCSDATHEIDQAYTIISEIFTILGYDIFRDIKE